MKAAPTPAPHPWWPSRAPRQCAPPADAAVQGAGEGSLNHHRCQQDLKVFATLWLVLPSPTASRTSLIGLAVACHDEVDFSKGGAPRGLWSLTILKKHEILGDATPRLQTERDPSPSAAIHKSLTLSWCSETPRLYLVHDGAEPSHREVPPRCSIRNGHKLLALRPQLRLVSPALVHEQRHFVRKRLNTGVSAFTCPKTHVVVD